MADTKVTALTELTTPAGGDMLYIVDDPAGTPLSRKVTVTNLFGAIATRITSSQNGAVSAPAVSFTGSAFTGGSATTTKPLCLIEPSGATSTGWSTSGTLLGVNAASGFSGNLLDVQLNGRSYLRVRDDFGVSLQIDETQSNNIKIYAAFGIQLNGTAARYVSWNGDTFLYRDAANTLALRNLANEQKFHIYNTTDAGVTNYERGFARWSGNRYQIGVEAAGTGSNRSLAFVFPSDIWFGTAANPLNRAYLNSGGFSIPSSAIFGWSNNTTDASGPDTSLSRVAAAIIGLRNGSTGGASLNFVEQTAPSAPAANGVYIYAEDNGSGKTRLMALFNTGTAQQIAIEP